jgi:hypothetical protein
VKKCVKFLLGAIEFHYRVIGQLKSHQLRFVSDELHAQHITNEFRRLFKLRGSQPQPDQSFDMHAIISRCFSIASTCQDNVPSFSNIVSINCGAAAEERVTIKTIELLQGCCDFPTPSAEAARGESKPGCCSIHDSRFVGPCPALNWG